MPVKRTQLKFDVFKDVKQHYPYILAKNKPRLAKLFHAYYEAAGRFPKAVDIYPYMLTAAGIPAAEVVGPWWARSEKIKSPMDWIRILGTPSDGLGRWSLQNRSPLIGNWLMDIGLDQHDRALADSVSLYYRNHGRIPSVQWARQRNNELEEARKESEIADQIPDVTAWLKASRDWRKEPEMVDIPEMPDPTFRIVEPKDAKLLCERAKKDGLCVIDVIQNELMDEDPHGERPEDCLDEDELEEYHQDPIFVRSKQMGVCTLIISEDPKRRTVVGLNEKGVCTSEHHCTGKNNEVDMVAWEYFKKR